MVEHAMHVSDPRSIPGSNGLIEGLRMVEHAMHVSDPGSIPRANGLIEGHRIGEHVLHIGDPRSVPWSNGLIEGRVVEHVLHISDPWRVPGFNGLIEGLRVVEHVLHISCCGLGRQPGSGWAARWCGGTRCRCVGSGPLLWQPARSWWYEVGRPCLVSKVWPSRRMVTSGGGWRKVGFGNGGPPGAGGCRLGRRAVWCCPLGRCINIELLFALPIALVGDWPLWWAAWPVTMVGDRRGARGRRARRGAGGGSNGHPLNCISVTREVFHDPMGWLKAA